MKQHQTRLLATLIALILFSLIQFTAYVPAPGEVSCGVRRVPENVVLTYRPTSDPKDARAKIDGDAIAVELVPKDFQLKN